VLRQKLARGEPIDFDRPKQRGQTFAEFAPNWFEDYVKPNNKYSEQLAKKYVLSSSPIPYFGSKPMRRIRIE
jgi:hypothetical protein